MHGIPEVPLDEDVSLEEFCDHDLDCCDVLDVTSNHGDECPGVPGPLDLPPDET